MILLNLYIDEQSADHALQVRLNNTTILLFYLDKLEDKTSEVHDKKNVPLIGKSRKNTHKSGCSRKKILKTTLQADHLLQSQILLYKETYYTFIPCGLFYNPFMKLICHLSSIKHAPWLLLSLTESMRSNSEISEYSLLHVNYAVYEKNARPGTAILM